MRACVCVCVCNYVCPGVCVCVGMSSFCCFSVEEMFCICAFDSVVLSVLLLLFFLSFFCHIISVCSLCGNICCVHVSVCVSFFLFVLEY